MPRPRAHVKNAFLSRASSTPLSHSIGAKPHRVQEAPCARDCCGHAAEIAPDFSTPVAHLYDRDAVPTGPLPDREGREPAVRRDYLWVASNTGNNEVRAPCAVPRRAATEPPLDRPRSSETPDVTRRRRSEAPSARSADHRDHPPSHPPSAWTYPSSTHGIVHNPGVYRQGSTPRQKMRTEAARQADNPTALLAIRYVLPVPDVQDVRYCREACITQT